MVFRRCRGLTFCLFPLMCLNRTVLTVQAAEEITMKTVSLDETQMVVESSVFFPGQADVGEIARQELPPYYEPEPGVVYSLYDWYETSEVIEGRSVRASSTVSYYQVEWGQELPATRLIQVKDPDTGQSVCGEFPVLQRRESNERWAPDFSFSLVFHSYDSDYFLLGEEKIPFNGDKPQLEGQESALLEMIGVPQEAYRIAQIRWEGEPYEDDQGILCRNAVALGERLVKDIEVTYGGDQVLDNLEGKKMIGVYVRETPKEQEDEIRVIATGSQVHAGSNGKDKQVRNPGMIEYIWIATVSLAAAGLLFLSLAALFRRIIKREWGDEKNKKI